MMTSAMETRRINVLREGHAHITDAICTPRNWRTPMAWTTRRFFRITAFPFKVSISECLTGGDFKILYISVLAS